MAGPDKDQKTHEPTPRRKEQARREGDVARSKDLTIWATVVGGLVGGIVFLERTLESMGAYMQTRFLALDGEVGPPAIWEAAGVVGWAAAPSAVGAVLAWVVVSGIQLGWPPAIKPLKFDITKIITFQAAMQIFSPKQAAIRGGMAAAKVLVVLIAAALAIRSESDLIASLPAMSPGALGLRMGPVAQRAIEYGAGALAVLAAVDVWHQRKTANEQLRMTPEEVKREHKDSEGDPQIKQKRRRRAQELAKKPRPEIAVRTADVVIVNPTHYSIALRYDKSKDSAPRVVAKGKDGLAAKIREVARRNSIPIVEKPPLARLMFKLVPDGEVIPENLYNAVAEVLAYVYRLRHRGTQ